MMRKLHPVIGPIAFSLISWIVYYDGIIEDAIVIIFYFSAFCSICILIFYFLGISFDSLKNDIEIIAVPVSFCLIFLGLSALTVLVFAFISVIAAYVQAAFDVPWTTLQGGWILAIGMVCLAGVIWQYQGLAKLDRDYRRKKEEGEIHVKIEGNNIILEKRGTRFQPITKPLFWIIIFAISLILLNIIGVTHYPYTIGMLLGSLFGIALFRLLIMTGLIKALSFWLSDGTAACETIGFLSSHLLEQDDLLLYIMNILSYLGEILKLIIENPNILNIILNYPNPHSWMDTSWQGTINLSSFVVSALAMAGCGLPIQE